MQLVYDCIFFFKGVTILLSLTVFLQLVAETMPPTSDAVPLIGRLTACRLTGLQALHSSLEDAVEPSKLEAK